MLIYNTCCAVYKKFRKAIKQGEAQSGPFLAGPARGGESSTMPTSKKSAATVATKPCKEETEPQPLIRSDRVRRKIADDIISGVLRPGEELDELRLAKAFNVSRTPVREALRQLAAAQLIEWRPHQSAVVAKITPWKMVEMFEVMAELEGFCGRLAARRMTPAEQAALKSIHVKMRPFVDARDHETYHAMNKDLHAVIYAGSHNRYLIDQATVLYSRLAPYRAFQLKRPDALRAASQEHAAIIDAIVSGDGDAAHRLLANHVSLDNELFADLVAELSKSDSGATA
jgi:DNA-binding GntR family transcriptional regulator